MRHATTFCDHLGVRCRVRKEIMFYVASCMSGEKKGIQNIIRPSGNFAALLPNEAAPMIARGVDRVVINRMLPAIVFGLVAAVAFLALATAIGAVAAYIWYCQSNGYGWPGFTVPGPKGGIYRLGCWK